MTKTRIWLLTFRPKTLFAGIAPLLMAIGLSFSYNEADGLSTNLFHIFLFLIMVITAQISANLTNDYFDAKNGIDDDERIGPRRSTQKKDLSTNEIKIGIFISFIVPALIGIFFSFSVHWSFAIITAVSLLASYSYTGGSFPLSYYGFGEILAFVFFGPVPVNSIFFILTGQILPTVFLFSFIPGVFAIMLMGINNYRDRDTDKKNDKVTLAILFGKKFCKLEYSVCCIIVCILPLIIDLLVFDKSIIFNYHLLSSTLAFFIFPFVPSIQKVWQEKIFLFNQVLSQTAFLLFIYHIIFFLIITVTSNY